MSGKGMGKMNTGTACYDSVTVSLIWRGEWINKGGGGGEVACEECVAVALLLDNNGGGGGGGQGWEQ